MGKRIPCRSWILVCAWASVCVAQPATVNPPDQPPDSAVTGAPAPAESLTPAVTAPGSLIAVPALTPLRLRLADPVSSNVNKPGDRFRITVIEDVKVGEVVVIPAGSEGEGEVIHAARSGAGGKPGELLLTGRFLRVGDQTIRLRSFVLGGAGRDRMDQAMATSFVAGPFAMFVRGGVIVIPVGTEGTAKTLETVQLPATQPGTVESAPTPEPSPVPASPTEPPAEAPAPATPESVPPDGTTPGE